MSTTVTDERGGWLDRLPVRAALALVVAVAVNSVIVVAAGSAGITPDFMALTLPPVAFLSAAGVVGAAVVYWWLRGRSDDPNCTFRRVALAVLAVSFLPDLALLVFDEAATVPGVIVLMVMHVTVAATSLWLLPTGD